MTERDLGMEWREELEIVFLLQGCGRLNLGESAGAAKVKERDLFIVNCYQPRFLALEPGGAALAMYISPSLLTAEDQIREVAFVCQSYMYPEEQQENFDRIREDFACIFSLYTKNEGRLSIRLRGRINLLLANLMEYFSVCASPKAGSLERLRIATDYIHRNYRDEISLGEIAAQVYLSDSYLSHLFRKELGRTFTEYLTEVRLSHGIALLNGSKKITEIAMEIGFPDTKAFITAFKKYYHTTPEKYRKQHRQKAEILCWEPRQEASDLLAVLAEYTEQSKSDIENEDAKTELRLLEADLTKEGKPLTHKWRMVMNAGYAKDIRNFAVREQVKKMQEKMGYRYIRCKGVLDDGMMTCNASWTNGQIIYNFVYIDECIDYILSLGALPWLELSHMPSALAKELSDRKYGMKFTIYSMPEEQKEWLSLIAELMKHLISRYTAEEIKKWIIMPLFSPSYSVLGNFGQEEWWTLWKDTVCLLRKMLPELKIAGANIEINDEKTSRWFLEKCLTEGGTPDIFSMLSFHLLCPDEQDGGMEVLFEDEGWPMAVSGDSQYIRHHYERQKKYLKEISLGNIPVVLAEWSNTVWQRDLCNDTSYRAAYLFKNILENYDRVDGMGIWSVSDQMEETVPSSKVFHGGLGLFSRFGMPKASYRALELLNRMEGRMLKRGDGYFLTQNRDRLQIYLYNYTHYDTLYRYRHSIHLTNTDRYGVFNAGKAHQYHIQLRKMTAGRYRIQRYSIGPEGGNAFAAWVSQGAPEVDGEEWEFLLGKSLPEYYQESADVGTEYVVSAILVPHEVQLIVLTRISRAAF